MPKPREKTSAPRPSEEAIAKRAYELSLQRGSLPGHEVDDWLQAEAELLAAAAEAERGSAAPKIEGSEGSDEPSNGRPPMVRRPAGRRESTPSSARRSLRE